MSLRIIRPDQGTASRRSRNSFPCLSAAFPGSYRYVSGNSSKIVNALLNGTCPTLASIALPTDHRTYLKWFNTSCFNTVSSQQLANNLITLPLLHCRSSSSLAAGTFLGRRASYVQRASWAKTWQSPKSAVFEKE